MCARVDIHILQSSRCWTCNCSFQETFPNAQWFTLCGIPKNRKNKKLNWATVSAFHCACCPPGSADLVINTRHCFSFMFSMHLFSFALKKKKGQQMKTMEVAATIFCFCSQSFVPFIIEILFQTWTPAAVHELAGPILPLSPLVGKEKGEKY